MSNDDETANGKNAPIPFIETQFEQGLQHQMMNPQMMNPQMMNPQMMNLQMMNPQMMNPQMMMNYPQMMPTQMMQPNMMMHYPQMSGGMYTAPNINREIELKKLEIKEKELSREREDRLQMQQNMAFVAMTVNKSPVFNNVSNNNNSSQQQAQQSTDEQRREREQREREEVEKKAQEEREQKEREEAEEAAKQKEAEEAAKLKELLAKVAAEEAERVRVAAEEAEYEAQNERVEKMIRDMRMQQLMTSVTEQPTISAPVSKAPKKETVQMGCCGACAHMFNMLWIGGLCCGLIFSFCLVLTIINLIMSIFLVVVGGCCSSSDPPTAKVYVAGSSTNELPVASPVSKNPCEEFLIYFPLQHSYWSYLGDTFMYFFCNCFDNVEIT